MLRHAVKNFLWPVRVRDRAVLGRRIPFAWTAWFESNGFLSALLADFFKIFTQRIDVVVEALGSLRLLGLPTRLFTLVQPYATAQCHTSAAGRGYLSDSEHLPPKADVKRSDTRS
jgi:hypothetical protein